MQNILIVEDDMDIQELLQEFLQEAGYKADIAGDGVEAVDMFASNSYDLILLDIMLPKIQERWILKQSVTRTIILSVSKNVHRKYMNFIRGNTSVFRVRLSVRNRMQRWSTEQGIGNSGGRLLLLWKHIRNLRV